jgi:hypothetical protein
MEEGVKNKGSYYARHKQERKEYQRDYRYTHLEEVRKKDRERKRKRLKPLTPIVFDRNVSVVFD